MAFAPVRIPFRVVALSTCPPSALLTLVTGSEGHSVVKTLRRLQVQWSSDILSVVARQPHNDSLELLVRRQSLSAIFVPASNRCLQLREAASADGAARSLLTPHSTVLVHRPLDIPTTSARTAVTGAMRLVTCIVLSGMAVEDSLLTTIIFAPCSPR